MSVDLAAQPPRAAAAAPPLRIEGVSKSFRQGDSKVDAVREVSLTLERGQFLAVMGASGSGKSTLLHLAAGLTSPNAGRICIEDEDLSKLSDAALTRFRRRRIGIVFQAFNLIPSLTAEDNIRLPMLTAKAGDAEINERLEKLLERLGLTQRRRHRPDALSGGEQQRVAIARALINDPALVLADEPTGSLDSVTGQSICKILRELAEEQRRTIVVVTHEPAVAAWAQRVLIMKDGRKLTEFDANEFHDAPSLAARYRTAVDRSMETRA